MTAPVVDPNAGIEILEKELWVDDWDENDRTAGMRYHSFSYEEALSHKTITTLYARTKIFNRQGIETAGSANSYSYDDKTTSVKMFARVIKPDGTIIDVKDSDCFTRETYRFGDVRVKTKSCAMPGLEPGCIVDLWVYATRPGWADNEIYAICCPAPIQHAKIHIRPTKLCPWLLSYDGLQNPVKENSSNWVETEFHNLPALEDDPFRPGEYGVQPWLTVCYDRDTLHRNNPPRFWNDLGNSIEKFGNRKISGGKSSIKKKVAELTQGTTDPNERLKRLYEFCTHQIVNLSSSNSGLSISDLQNLEDNDSVGKTLESGKGTAFDITILFASLAKADGRDVHLALCNNRMMLNWNASVLTPKLVDDLIVAIRTGDKWSFYEPGELFTAFGMLKPGNEGTVAIVGSDGDKAVLVLTPNTPSDKSKLLRKGTFTISEDGTLTGAVEETYIGQSARSLKKRMVDKTPEQMADALGDDIHECLPSANITQVNFTNVHDPERPVIVTYKVTVPGYAEVSGKRLFLQPCYFEKGAKPIFDKATRSREIRQPYAWESHDEVRITYPQNYEIEEGAAPNSLLDSDTFAYVVELGISKTHPVVVYKRDNKFNVLSMPSKLYGELKKYTDAIAQEDGHVLTLKLAPKPAATQGNADKGGASPVSGANVPAPEAQPATATDASHS